MIGKGISSVISSVEGSLGIPSPTSSADGDKEKEKIVSKLANGMSSSLCTVNMFCYHRRSGT